MRKFILKGCLALFVSVMAIACETEDDKVATGSIYGNVTDADNGEPIRSATVSLNPGGLSASTGSDGRYEFLDLLPNQYTVQIVKSDYQSNTKRVTVVSGQTASGDLVLTKGSSKIKASTNLLDFGTKSSSLSFSVMNVGTLGNVSWSLSKEGLAWLSVSPTSGTIEAGKSQDVIVTIARSNIKENVEGILLLNGNGESYSITVKAQAGTGGTGGTGGNANLAASLVAYYTFDGSDAKDATDNGLNGSLINSPDFVDGVSGKALFLNGMKEQYMNIPYNPFKGYVNYSVSMWVKDFGQGVLFSALGSDTKNYDYPRLLAESTGKFVFYTQISYGEDPFTYLYKSIQDGGWHMVTVVCRKTTGSSACIKDLYIDGVLVDSSSGEVNSATFSTKVHIGGNGDGKYNVFQSMKVDNVRIYTRKLEADEVAAIYELER